MINPGSFFDFLWKVLIIVTLTSTFVFGALVISQSFLKTISGRYFKACTRASLVSFFAIVVVLAASVLLLDKGLQLQCFNHFTESQGILGLTRILAGVWAIVGVVLLTKDLLQFRLFKKTLSANVLKSHSGYQVVTNDYAPLTVGFLESQIIIPENLENSKEHLSYILAHESVHVKNRDGVWSLLALMCLRLCWFNPAAWFFFKAHSLSVEMATDEEVVSVPGVSAHKYAEALVAVLEMRNTAQILPGTLAASAEFLQMQNRLQSLKAKAGNKKSSRWIFAAMLSAAWFVGIEQSVASLQLERKTQIEELMCYQVHHEKVLESLFRSEVATNKCE